MILLPPLRRNSSEQRVEQSLRLRPDQPEYRGSDGYNQTARHSPLHRLGPFFLFEKLLNPLHLFSPFLVLIFYDAVLFMLSSFPTPT
jgi:hypothetical protein